MGGDHTGPQSRLHRWQPVDRGELLKLLIWVFLKCHLLKIIGTETLSAEIVLFLKLCHAIVFSWVFADNKKCPGGDRLFKVKPLYWKHR